MKTPVFIRIYKGEQLIEVKQFTESQIIIGSGETAQLRIDDQSVSPIHALIEERETGYFICDLGSQSGTLRNGERILDIAIASGDQVHLGDITLEFFQGVPKPKAPPKPTGEETVVATTVVVPPPPTAPAVPAPVVAEQTTLSSLGIKEEVVTQQPVFEDEKTPVKEDAKPVIPVAAVIPEIKTEAKAQDTFVAPPSQHGKTFAPPSAIKDLGEVIKPTRGNVVEVVTAWRERVLNTYHFSERKVVTLGGNKTDDVFLPVFGDSQQSYPLLRLDAAAVVFLRLDGGALLRKEKQVLTLNELMGQNRLMAQNGGMYGLVLEQGESLRIDFPNEVYVYIRYVNNAPKPITAPILDFTSVEMTGFVMSFVLIAILGLYVALYSPPPGDQKIEEEQPMAVAKFVAPNIPRPKPPPPPPQEKKVELPTPKEQKPQVKPQTDKAEGRAAEVRPKHEKNKPKMVTSAVPQGGAIKTADKDGANVQSKQPKDVTKTGLLGVFGSKGAQTELSKAYSGTGELQGVANQATGTAGSATNRPGEGLGAQFKDTGAGGKGTATVGIAGVGTNGSGFGRNGYGTGGLGERKGTLVIPGGAEESFDTQIDREAIRRVVKSHLREVQYCYEKELNQDPNLSGKVLITWEIGPGGRVVSASVASSTIERKSVGDCLVARLKTWKFPDPPADKIPNVTYPFLFQKN